VHYLGIGKTTLTNEICLKWARDGFLSEDFDAVILISLRLVQQRSLEEVMIEHIGKESCQCLIKSTGARCLIVLEGFDEMAIIHQDKDPFLVRLIKECTILEEATIAITSRPHACEKLKAGRRIEVVGFGRKEIREFVELSFLNDNLSVKQFVQQLEELPHLCSLCYIPMNLVMVTDIFHCSQKKLPSTLTNLYQLFIAMALQRQAKKDTKNKPLLLVEDNEAEAVEKILCKILAGLPKESLGTVFLLSKLAYYGFFKWCSKKEENKEYYVYDEWKEPKIIFTLQDLGQCGINVTVCFDGFGLLKATHTHQLPTDTIIYNFAHLSIQEFLCAVYIATLSQQEQQDLLCENFYVYPNVFCFLCGLTGLVSNEISQFVFSKLSSNNSSDVVTAARFIYESKETDPYHVTQPSILKTSETTLLPYECLCISYVLSCYPVSELKMWACDIDDKGAEMLVKHYSDKHATYQQLEKLLIGNNYLTTDGLIHVMKIVRESK